MRPVFLYGSILLFCFIITTVSADKKWKNEEEIAEPKTKKLSKNDNDKSEKKKENPKSKTFKENNDNTDEDVKQLGKKYQKVEEGKKAKNKLTRQQPVDDSSEEDNKSNKFSNDQPVSKKFIGRIEHGKVKVLRRKDEKKVNDDDDDYNDDNEEDSKEEVCSRKSKKGCNGNDDDSDSEEDKDNSSEEEDEKKPKKRIKYSIKFAHEKQKKKENNGDISIMRIHKNGRKKYGKYDDDDSSEEDDKPLKRFHFVDDDD